MPTGICRSATPSALGGLALEDVAAFHAARFQPSRATVVVAGPLSHDDLVRLVEDAFGGVAGDIRRHCQGHPAGDVEPIGLADAAGRRAARGGAAVGAADRTPVGAAEHAGLPGAARDERRARRPVRQPDQPEAARGEGLHVRRAHRVRLAPRASRRSRCRPASTRRATADAIADCLAELDGIRGSRPPSDTRDVAREGLAHARISAQLRDGTRRSRGPSRSSRCTDFPTRYFEEFVPRVHAVESADVVRVAERYVDPARAVTLVVGDYQRGIGAARLATSSDSTAQTRRLLCRRRLTLSTGSA